MSRYRPRACSSACEDWSVDSGESSCFRGSRDGRCGGASSQPTAVFPMSTTANTYVLMGRSGRATLEKSCRCGRLDWTKTRKRSRHWQSSILGRVQEPMRQWSGKLFCLPANVALWPGFATLGEGKCCTVIPHHPCHVQPWSQWSPFPTFHVAL